MKFLAMTSLPVHIERRLLEFNIVQLCALVSEKSGSRWIGASDKYGPIQEIARRWKHDELFHRIRDMQSEDLTVSYARVMTAIGGNPAREQEVEKRKNKGKILLEQFQKRVGNPDDVKTALADCATLSDLKAVAKAKGLKINWEKCAGLANFGLQRMYVGNAWRHQLKA